MPRIEIGLTLIPRITNLDLVRQRKSRRTIDQTGNRTGGIGRQRFVSDAVETDWGQVVREQQVVKRSSPQKPQLREVVVPRGNIEMGQTVEVHPDEEDLLIVLQYSGINIKGEFHPGKNHYGDGNAVFYAPVSFWRKGKEEQASLIVATWEEKKILESQVAYRINRSHFFKGQVSLTQLADYDPRLNGIHPNIDNYNLSGMEISGRGNIVTVTYPLL